MDAIEGITTTEEAEEVVVECTTMTADIMTVHEAVDVAEEEVLVVHHEVDMEVVGDLEAEDTEDPAVNAVVVATGMVVEEEDDLVVQWAEIAMARDLDDEEDLEVVHEEVVRGEVLEVMTVLNAEDMVDIKLLFVSWPHPLSLSLTVYREMNCIPNR